MFTISGLHPSSRFSTHSLMCMVIIAVLFCSNCSFIPSKDNYVSSFSAFVADLKTNATTYTQDDWNKADLKFNKYAEQDYNKYRNELTEGDKEVVGKLKES